MDFLSLRKIKDDNLLSDEEAIVLTDSLGDAHKVAMNLFGDKYQLEALNPAFYRNSDADIVLNKGEVNLRNPGNVLIRENI